MSNIVGNYSSAAALTESRTLCRVPAGVSADPVDEVETRAESGNPPRGGHPRRKAAARIGGPAMSIDTAHRSEGVPWADVLFSAIAAVSWALIGMAGTAALGLHLVGADRAGSLGPMTAAVVALGAGGSVTPSGDVSVFGLEDAQATTAVQITPLGVGLVGALLLSWFFLRSLRAAGAVVPLAELLARAGAVLALFVALLGGLAWAGHTVVTIDGGGLGLDDLPGGGGVGDDAGGLPGLGDLGDIGDVGNIGGLLPDRLGDLAAADAKVGFAVDTVPTLLGGLLWCAGVLLIALLASRRTPLPPRWHALHRVVRPAASALVTVLLTAVLAGLAAAAYAAIGDAHPKRIAGAALLGAPNGVWLGVPLGLLVPWDGTATGGLALLLPDPLDDLLRTGEPLTLGRLAELDGRVWLLGVAAALMMLLAGVLTAVRTPFVRGPGGAVTGRPGGMGSTGVRGSGPLGLVVRCASRLAVVTALTLPLLVWLTEVSVDASLSVFGFDAFGSAVELRGRMGAALLLGALWGAGAGAAGALLACACGAAGRRATVWARGGTVTAPAVNAHAGLGAREAQSGPYTPGTPYRPPNPDTNPYLRLPDELRRREPEDARPAEERDRGGGRGRGTGDAHDPHDGPHMGLYGAPTLKRPIVPPPGTPPQRPGRGARSGARNRWVPPPPPDDEPPPPPPPPPPAPPPPSARPPGR